MHIHEMVIYDDEIHLNKESNSVNAKQSVLQMTTVPIYLSTVSLLANNISINKKAISILMSFYTRISSISPSAFTEKEIASTILL